MAENQQGKPKGFPVFRWLTILLIFLVVSGIGLYEVYRAKQNAVPVAAPRDTIPNAAKTLCDCAKDKSKPAVRNTQGRRKADTKQVTASPPPVPKAAPVASAPPPAQKAPEQQKELLAGVNPDFNRTKFVPNEEPKEVVVVEKRVVDIEPPHHHGPCRTGYHDCWTGTGYSGGSYWGPSYVYNGPYGADNQRIVGGQVYPPAPVSPPVGSPPTGYTGGGPANPGGTLPVGNTGG